MLGGGYNQTLDELIKGAFQFPFSRRAQQLQRLQLGLSLGLQLVRLVPGTVRGGSGLRLLLRHINVVVQAELPLPLPLLVQHLQPLLLIVVIEIGQVVKVAIVDNIDFGVVAAIAFWLLGDCDCCFAIA